MKKLALFIYSMGAGGAERVVSNLLPYLAKSFEVHLILMNESIFYELPKQIKVHYLERSNPYENGILKLLKLPLLAFKYKKALNSNIDVLEYLYDRGLDDNDIESFGLGYDSYNRRIVFPLYDKYKNVVGFNKRITEPNTKGEVKYKNSSNSEIFNKSSYLYGIHNLDDSCNEIRITEGSMDVILAHKYGVKNVVATLGTSFTEKHAKAIYKTGKTPVLIFDGDSAGNKGIYKALSYFEALGVYCKIVELPFGKDLADMANEKKLDLERYIKERSLTAGYLQLRNIINSYQSSLYELKLCTTPKIEEVLDFVPYTEKRILKSFVKDELNISL